jgi:hypothetical protein
MAFHDAASTLLNPDAEVHNLGVVAMGETKSSRERLLFSRQDSKRNSVWVRPG